MTASGELRKLKSEILSFDCLNYNDLQFYTRKIADHIRLIYSSNGINDEFLRSYIQAVVIRHLEIVEDYVNNLHEYEGKEPFITRALKYHFNCIIDSFTFATIVHQY